MSAKSSKNKKKSIDDMSNKELDEYFGKMKRLPHGTFLAKQGATEPKNIKVSVTVKLDLDVLNYFKALVANSTEDTIDNRVNEELRNIIELKQSKRLSTTARVLLNDKQFIAELKKKLKAA